MRCCAYRATPTIVACLCLALAASAESQTDSTMRVLPGRATCGTGIPTSETSRFVALPRGDVFCPLIADPKELGSFASYVHGTSSVLPTRMASVGIGDRFGLLRWGGARPDDGVQLSIVGSVFAQVEWGSWDLINADYLIGLPLTIRSGRFSARLRVYHQSSHLGDEFLLRANHPERENLSFESAELILSQERGPLRLYGGGEVLLRRDPRTLERMVAHVGAEVRQTGGVLPIGRAGSARLVAALDVKSTQEQDWRPGWSLRAGIEFSRPHDLNDPGRRWRILGEYYHGPSPYGQFFLEKTAYYGVGLHFTL